MRLLLNEMAHAGTVLLNRPFQCLVQLTNRCNMSCDFCDFWPNGVGVGAELTVADFEKLSADLKKIGTFLVSLEGGEPFVRSDLAEIVRAFSKRHVTVLFTNGWYVTDAKARELFRQGLAQVGVSIDYPDAQRHDARRKMNGAFIKASEAIGHFKRAAPRGGRGVHVMTVLMRENQNDIEALLQMSRDWGVGHCFTLVSDKGFRRGDRGILPAAPLSRELLRLYTKYPHMRLFRDYYERVDDFLTGAPMPSCQAGRQSFNVDHVGNVAACIEKINEVHGNIRDESLTAILARMRRGGAGSCQDCWTLCRGLAQALSNRGSAQAWHDLALRRQAI